MVSLDGMMTIMRMALTAAPSLTILILLREGIMQHRPDILDVDNRVRAIDIDEVRDEYDFVIVGGGSAGCVLASRLSENPSFSVLLLEAGPDEPLLTDLPQLFPLFQRGPFDWAYTTEPSDQYCLAMINQRCRWPRGRVLGGSSVLNAMMYIRGNRKDYDQWASLGNPGWNYDQILHYFKKMEDMRDPNLRGNPYHGVGGPITVERFRFQSPLVDVFMHAAGEMNLVNPYGDFNGKSQLGFTYPHGTLRNGLRCSANKAYIRPVWHRTNLHVLMNAFVHRININPDTKVAESVTYEYDDDGHKRLVFATKEVILSAGAIQSPQLLMLSGIGPAEQLEEYDIDVLYNSRGVGSNLQDHVALTGASYLIDNKVTDHKLSFILPQLMTAKNVEAFVEKKSGFFYASPVCEIMGYINTKYQDPRENWPDIQMFLGSYGYTSDGGLIGRLGTGISMENYADIFEPILYEDSYMIMPLLMRPNSRGRLLIQSSDARIHPKIYANYFEDPEDLARMVDAAKFIHSISHTRIMRHLNATLNIYSWRNCPDEEYLSDDFWACMARYYSQTIYHPVGTCKMGPRNDPYAVVDPRLRVYGVKGLRVVDASIMPRIVSGNTNAPTMMIAEKAADMIKEEHLHYRGRNYQASAAQYTWLFPNKIWPEDYGPTALQHGLQEYDFVVIGAGTAGSVVASRLSENPEWRVLVLEAGGDPPIHSEIPALPILLLQPEYNYNYYSQSNGKSCLSTWKGACHVAQGKMIGGSGGINAMIYIRGNRQDFDGWKEMGNFNWGWDDVVPYFQKAELSNLNNTHTEVNYLRKSNDHLGDILLNAAQEMGFRKVKGFDEDSNIGYGPLLATVKDGLRMSSGKTYLGKARERPNLHVIKNAVVNKINFHDKRVIGLDFAYKGVTLYVRLTKEVVLSAGSIGSSKLLLLSGIGPKQHLKSHGVHTVQDLPVGNNLNDHLIVPLFYKMQESSAKPFSVLNMIKELYSYITSRSGFLAEPQMASMGAFVNSNGSTSSSVYPDIQFYHIFVQKKIPTLGILMKIYNVPDVVSDILQGIIGQANMLVALVVLLKPKSVGNVRLRSKDYKVDPKIFLNYLENEEDAETLIRGVKTYLQMEQTKSFQKEEIELMRPSLPECDDFQYKSDIYWRCYLKYLTTGSYHVAGTVKMGPDQDESAVVDWRLRVKGIDGLRVADASVMPKVVSANTYATTVMIAERLADFVKEDWSGM